jgi:hypothetical protein
LINPSSLAVFKGSKPGRIPTGSTRQLLVAAITNLDKGRTTRIWRINWLRCAVSRPPISPEGRCWACRGADCRLAAWTARFQRRSRDAVLRCSGGERVHNCHEGRYQPFAEEIDDEEPHFEGALSTVRVNRYERDHEARESCIAHHTVCPNCHAMLHKRIPPYSIDELSKLIRKGG